MKKLWIPRITLKIVSWRRIYLLVLINFFSSIFLQLIYAQCNNSTQYEDYEIEAPQYLDTILVADDIFAGEYYILKNLLLNKSYTFLSSALPPDYITVNDEYGNPVSYGTSPLTWTVTGVDKVYVSINLTSPPCGSQSTSRTAQVVCTDCSPIPPEVGVGNTVPQSDLDVGGIIKIANSNRPPIKGMIRWNNTAGDFEGYNGSEWVSFTQSNMPWGKIGVVESKENKKIFASDNMEDDEFGYSVGIHENYAIVGAPGKNNDEGGAYILKKVNNVWSESAILMAGGGAAGNRFGTAVSIDGDYVVMGAPNYGSSQGAAYVFHRSGANWTQQAILTASDGHVNDSLGVSVAIHGDDIIVGAIGDDSSKGSAYVFHRSGTNWTQQAKLSFASGGTGAHFGFSVDIENDFALIGAPNESSAGEAYYFHRTGSSWSFYDSNISLVGGNLGYSVALSNNISLITRPSGNQVRILKYLPATGWTNDTYIYDKDYISADLDSETMVLGHNKPPYSSGKDLVDVYKKSYTDQEWIKEAVLTASDGQNYDEFGKSVSIYNFNIIVGAPYDKIDNSPRGSVYLYTK